LKSIETSFAARVVHALEKKALFLQKVQAITSVKTQFQLSIAIT